MASLQRTGHARPPGFAPVAALDAESDEDDDGLPNQDEVYYGSNPNKRDTDDDGVGDLLDGWPQEPLLQQPRVNIQAFALSLIEQAPAFAIGDMNDLGDVVYLTNGPTTEHRRA